MGLLAKAKAESGSNASADDNSANGNMGLLVVFFPEDDSAIADKTKLFSTSSIVSSSSSSSSSRSPAPSFRRRNSRFLLSKAQSTISICALFIFITLPLFTLSTFEPSSPSPRNTFLHNPPRRFLSQKPPTSIRNITNNPTSKSRIHNWLPQMWTPRSSEAKKIEYSFPSTALQRMGTLYRRGTRVMSDLVVAHAVEDTTDDELRLFLRVLHRSGLTVRADVVFIFASASSSSRFGSIIQQENDLFLSLINHYTELNSTDASLKKKPESNFDAARFFKDGKKGKVIGEPLWGKKSRSDLTNPEAEKEVDPLSYGSILSFVAAELDPENSLAGFLYQVPLKLRRWACYPMLLGRVKRNFKHVMLVDAKNLVVTSDPLGRVRNRSSESVFMYSAPGSKHSKKISDKTQSNSPVDSAVVMGGERGIRRLSNAMLIGIVRAATQHKKKNSGSESAILNQLVGNGYVLKNINLIPSTESIPDATSLGGRNSASFPSLSDYPIIHRGTSNRELNSLIKKQLCFSDIDSSVYRDC